LWNPIFVIPAKAGIQETEPLVDSRSPIRSRKSFAGVTALETFYEAINIKIMIKGKAGISLTERTECTEKNNKNLSDLCGLCLPRSFGKWYWGERKMRVSQMLRKRQSGFTLIEMMIVIAVLAIMSAIAIPNFMSLLPGMRLNGAARQVMGDLMAARMNAVKLNKRTKVFFSSSQYSIRDDANNDGTVESDESTTTPLPPPKNIQENYHDVSLSASSNPIFYARGTGPTPSCTITVTSSSTGQSKLVKAHLTGRVKIE